MIAVIYLLLSCSASIDAAVNTGVQLQMTLRDANGETMYKFTPPELANHLQRRVGNIKSIGLNFAAQDAQVLQKIYDDYLNEEMKNSEVLRKLQKVVRTILRMEDSN